MKTFIITSILTIFSLVVFLFIYSDEFNEANIAMDDEQNGLSHQIVIKFSHVVAENTPKGLAAAKFAELVNEKTHGKVKVEVFPNAILYSDEDEIDALKRGDIQMIAPSFSKLIEIVPEWKALDLPFIFRGDHHVKAVFTGDVGKELLNMLNQDHLKGLAFWSNGFKQMTSYNNVLIKPDDFRGQTFRVMPGDVIREQFFLLHAKPVVAPFDQVYRSLEKHEFDGQENTISNIYSKRFYNVQHYLTISNHGYLGYAVIMNKKFWNHLPPDTQSQLLEAIDETTIWNLNTSKEMNDAQLVKLRQSSDINVHVLTNEEKQIWINQFKPLYRSVEDEIDKELINQIRNVK